MKIKKNLIEKIKESQERFVERYNLGEIGNLMVASFSGEYCFFNKLDFCWTAYSGKELVFHLTPDHGVLVSFVSEWI